MRRFFSILTVLSINVVSATSCAFHEKNYVSRIVLEGLNHRPELYDEGVFYVNADPAIRMRMGCYASTQLGATMFPLIPLPILVEAEPHASIAAQRFSLTLSHRLTDEVNLTGLEIHLDVSGRVQRLSLNRDEVENRYSRSYEYMADLRCGETEDGVLSIRLSTDKVRVYGVRFKEGVERAFAFHPGFVT